MGGPTATQVAAYVAAKIRHAERTLTSLTDELTVLARRPSSLETKTKITEIAKWVARQNVLIEVWEFATGEQWSEDQRRS